jgi:hypothetical protein
VGVGVERGRDGGTSETLLNHLGMDPGGEQERGSGMCPGLTRSPGEPRRAAPTLWLHRDQWLS